MLDTIQLSTTDLPHCLFESVAPATAPKIQTLANQQNPAIERYINSLPKSKRWVVNQRSTGFNATNTSDS